MEMSIVANEKFVDSFTNKLLNNPQFVCVVIGPGKTYVCNTLFERYGFDVYKISGEGIATISQLSKLLEPHRDTLTIESFFSTKRKLLFLDDFDDYGINKTFHSYILSYMKHPNFASSGARLVLTISKHNEKYYKDFIKKIETFRVFNPDVLETYNHVLKSHPDIDKAKLMFLCKSMRGNIKSVINNIDFIDTSAFILHDRTVYDIVHMLYKKQIPTQFSDLIYSYDPRIVSMIYFDNMIKSNEDLRVRQTVASHFADMHIVDEFTHENGMMTDIWCHHLCLQPKLCDDDVYSYEYTKILNRTIQRYTNNKNIYNYMTSINIDSDARELYLDIVFDNVLKHGKKQIDPCAFDLCKSFIHNIGEIQKTYLDKLL
jgi:hypothetical protein